MTPVTWFRPFRARLTPAVHRSGEKQGAHRLLSTGAGWHGTPMSRVTPWAAKALASALVAAAAVAVVPSSAMADDTAPVDDLRSMMVQQSTSLYEAPAAAPVAAAPKQAVANFTARTTAAIRATRSASFFRWGTPAYAKWYAKSHIAQKYEWGPKQFGCLVSLWNRESHWGYRSTNRRGHTYGIPQTNVRTITAFGATFATYMKTPELQVQVGAKYINYRYGSPCKAYDHAKHRGWY